MSRESHAHGDEKRGEGSEHQPARVAREVNIAAGFLHLQIDVVDVTIQLVAVSRIERRGGSGLEEHVEHLGLFRGERLVQRRGIGGAEAGEAVSAIGLRLDGDAAARGKLREGGGECAAVAARGANVTHRCGRQALRGRYCVAMTPGRGSRPSASHTTR